MISLCVSEKYKFSDIFYSTISYARLYASKKTREVVKTMFTDAVASLPLRRDDKLQILDVGYGCYNGQCIPSCRFYSEFGVIEDIEIIESHNQVVEILRRDNRIVDAPTEAELQRLSQAYRFDLI